MTTAGEHIDVLIVGAGLSGIGAAYHLQRAFPQRTYTILESRGALGGTWDLFRYPGIRSDSDMYTLGYRFRPWLGDKAIADGDSILDYVRDTATEAGIDRNIRLHHRVLRAEWSTPDNRWTVTAQRTDTGETLTLTAGFLFSCSGYYRYDEPYRPDFPGTERFTGPIVHPQFWPEDLDYADKRVVIIGSGATAVTLGPALTERGAHVTMLQRSPSYVISMPEHDNLALRMRRFLPPKVAYGITRAKNVAFGATLYQLGQRFPDALRNWIRGRQEGRLPPDFDIDTHFNPAHSPWDQRVCVAPDGNLFRAIHQGTLDVVTDRIDTFTETGLQLASGATLDADIVITATGLNMLPIGGLELVVDGRKVSLPECMTYKAMMLSDVPNFAFIFGYTNASWTLRVDLVCEYVMRLLRHMDARGHLRCVPVRDESVTETSLFQNFTPGYIRRGAGQFPIQGSRAPWRMRMNYLRDVLTLRYGPITDSAMQFGRAERREPVGSVE